MERLTMPAGGYPIEKKAAVFMTRERKIQKQEGEKSFLFL